MFVLKKTDLIDVDIIYTLVTAVNATRLIKLYDSIENC